MTLFDVVTAVIEVTEDEHEVVPVIVDLLESGRVRRTRASARAARISPRADSGKGDRECEIDAR